MYSPYWLFTYPLVWAIVLSIPVVMRRPECGIKQYSSHTFFVLSAFIWELEGKKNISMKTFSREEIVAVYKAAYLMVAADGNVMSEEMEVANEAMEKLGIKGLTDIEELKTLSNIMTEDECYGQLAFLDIEQKQFVSAMLGAISSSDGDIDDAELELWRKICYKSDLPKMNNRQAIAIFQSY